MRARRPKRRGLSLSVTSHCAPATPASRTTRPLQFSAAVPSGHRQKIGFSIRPLISSTFFLGAAAPVSHVAWRLRPQALASLRDRHGDPLMMDLGTRWNYLLSRPGIQFGAGTTDFPFSSHPSSCGRFHSALRGIPIYCVDALKRWFRSLQSAPLWPNGSQSGPATCGA